MLEGCTVVPVDEGPDAVVAAVCEAFAPRRPCQDDSFRHDSANNP